MSESIFKALADPNRREILRLLGRRTMSAGEVASHFTIAKSTLSSHFNILKKADLIREEKIPLPEKAVTEHPHRPERGPVSRNCTFLSVQRDGIQPQPVIQRETRFRRMVENHHYLVNKRSLLT